MGVRAKMIAAAVGAVVALVVVACGDPDDALTKDEFIAQADAICAAATAELDEMSEPVWASLEGLDDDDPASEEVIYAAFVELMDQGAPILREQLADLRDLNPPRQDRELIETLIDDQEAAIDYFVEIVEGAANGDPAAREAMNSDEDPFDDVDRRARAYGLLVCGSDGPRVGPIVNP